MVGSPRVFNYPGIGRVSPTTLRYVKVASDLRKLFGAEPGGNVAEVGVGYGGQMLVCDIAFHMRQYDLFDLAPVLSLVELYLESHLLNCAYRTLTLNQCQLRGTPRPHYQQLCVLRATLGAGASVHREGTGNGQAWLPDHEQRPTGVLLPAQQALLRPAA